MKSNISISWKKFWTKMYFFAISRKIFHGKYFLIYLISRVGFFGFWTRTSYCYVSFLCIHFVAFYLTIVLPIAHFASQFGPDHVQLNCIKKVKCRCKLWTSISIKYLSKFIVQVYNLVKCIGKFLQFTCTIHDMTHPLVTIIV